MHIVENTEAILHNQVNVADYTPGVIRTRTLLHIIVNLNSDTLKPTYGGLAGLRTYTGGRSDFRSRFLRTLLLVLGNNPRTLLSICKKHAIATVTVEHTTRGVPGENYSRRILPQR